MEMKDSDGKHAEHVDTPDIVENYLERYSKFYGKFNIILVVVSGIVMSIVYVEVGTIGYILPISQCELQWTMQEKGLLGAIGTTGVILTSHFWGFMADTKGRKAVILPTLFIGFIFSFLSTLSNSFWVLFILKLLNGICVSAGSATIYAYIGEFHPNKTRDTAILASSVFAGVGCVLMPILAALIMNQEWSFHVPFLNINYTPWRLYMLLCAIPSLLCALIFLKLPESPKFLLSVGKREEAIRVLESIYEGEVEESPLLTKEDKPITDNTSMLQSMWDQTTPLFHRSYILITFLICALNFFCFATASGMYIWFPDIVNSVMEYVIENPDESGYMCDIYSKKLEGIYNETKLEDEVCVTSFEISTYKYGAFIECAYMVGYTLISVLINMVSGNVIMWTLLMFSGISGLVAVNIGSPIISVYLFISLMVAALPAQIVNSSTISLYPTHLRGMAINVGLMFGRIGAVFGSNYIGSLLRNDCQVSFYISGISLIVGAFLSLFVAKSKSKERKVVAV